MVFTRGLEDRPVIDALHALCSEFRCAALGSVSEIISDQCEEVIVNWRVVFHGVWAAHHARRSAQNLVKTGFTRRAPSSLTLPLDPSVGLEQSKMVAWNSLLLVPRNFRAGSSRRIDRSLVSYYSADPRTCSEPGNLGF